MLDSHCHLADDVFVPDLDEVIARAQSAGVSRALCIVDAVADEELTRARVLQAKWPGVERAVGVHPHQAGVFEARPGAAAEAVASRLAGAVAVGEIGLDYHYDFAPRAVQL
ncbi:MAG: TatD family hydrolase, partial [Vicinamibacterales bacterium]